MPGFLFDRRSPSTLLLTWKGLVAVIAVASLLCSGSGHEDSVKATSPSNAYVQAIANGKHGDYGAMLRQLRAAARQGDVQSQELLAVALLGGPAGFRYGGPTGQQTCEAVRWLDAAAIQGSRIGQAYVELMGPDEVNYALVNCGGDQDQSRQQVLRPTRANEVLPSAGHIGRRYAQAVRTDESSLRQPGREYGARGRAVRVVESMDGASTGDGEGSNPSAGRVTGLERLGDPATRRTTSVRNALQPLDGSMAPAIST